MTPNFRSVDAAEPAVLPFNNPMARVVRCVRERIRARGLRPEDGEKCLEAARGEFELSGGSEPLAISAGQRMADKIAEQARQAARARVWSDPTDPRPAA